MWPLLISLKLISPVPTAFFYRFIAWYHSYSMLLPAAQIFCFSILRNFQTHSSYVHARSQNSKTATKDRVNTKNLLKLFKRLRIIISFGTTIEINNNLINFLCDLHLQMPRQIETAKTYLAINYIASSMIWTLIKNQNLFYQRDQCRSWTKINSHRR